jgi:nitrate reductase NapE component
VHAAYHVVRACSDAPDREQRVKSTLVVVVAVLIVLAVAAIFPGAFGWVHFTGLSMRR